MFVTSPNLKMIISCNLILRKKQNLAVFKETKLSKFYADVIKMCKTRFSQYLLTSLKFSKNKKNIYKY